MDETHEQTWMLLLDSEWSPEAEDDAPPVDMIVGGWLVKGDGAIGQFEPNPDYHPSSPESPTDPVDAAARMAAAGRAYSDVVVLALRDCLTDVAMDEDGAPIVTDAPDGKPCVVIATGAANRRRVGAPSWRQTTAPELVNLLPEDVDVWLNPGGPASMRLFADSVRRSLNAPEDEPSE
jgi:hypothetical protein